MVVTVGSQGGDNRSPPSVLWKNQAIKLTIFHLGGWATNKTVIMGKSHC